MQFSEKYFFVCRSGKRDFYGKRQDRRIEDCGQLFVLWPTAINRVFGSGSQFKSRINTMEMWYSAKIQSDRNG